MSKILSRRLLLTSSVTADCIPKNPSIINCNQNVHVVPSWLNYWHRTDGENLVVLAACTCCYIHGRHQHMLDPTVLQAIHAYAMFHSWLALTRHSFTKKLWPVARRRWISSANRVIVHITAYLPITRIRTTNTFWDKINDIIKRSLQCTSSQLCMVSRQKTAGGCLSEPPSKGHKFTPCPLLYGKS